ncbi:hypothetical protein DID76_02360 [Candidatus Marinamargulisbacteria bacterium SCGC AG-414-C22]|nr:hypothetical protein DID76_02360 [Candidatus Marinamargulisbacteria bacterium SCGC AG-414-C22]
MFDKLTIYPHLNIRSFFRSPKAKKEKNIIYTSRATASLFILLKSLLAQHKSYILLPAYVCKDLIEPILALKLKPLYYSLDNQLNPNIDEIKKSISSNPEQVSLIIAVNYFGFKQNFEKLHLISQEYNIPFLEYCAHLVDSEKNLSKIKHTLHYKIYSPRKFFPLFDGGLLVFPSNKKLPIDHIEQKKLTSLIIWLFWQLMSNIRLYTLSSKIYNFIKKRFISPKSSLTTPPHYTPFTMSQFSTSLFLKQNSDNAIKIRHSHMTMMVETLESTPLITPLFKPLEDDSMPYFLPIQCPSNEKCKIEKIFNKAGLTLTTWPFLPDTIKGNPKYPQENEWANTILGIPISQHISTRKYKKTCNNLIKLFTVKI